MRGHCLAGQFPAPAGEADQHAAAVRRVRDPLRQPGPHERVDPVGHGTGRDDELLVELGRGEPVWRARAAQRGEHVQAAPVQPFFSQHFPDARVREVRHAQDPSDDLHGRGIEAGLLASPLRPDPPDPVHLCYLHIKYLNLQMMAMPAFAETAARQGKRALTSADRQQVSER